MSKDVEQDDVSLYPDIEAYLAQLEEAEQYVFGALLGNNSAMELAILSTGEDGDPLVGLILAQSELADANICTVLSTSSDSEVLEVILQNPLADKYALDNILSGPYGGFFALDVSIHPNCPPALEARATEIARAYSLSLGEER
jgi:hypothetical protein